MLTVCDKARHSGAQVPFLKEVASDLAATALS